MLLVNSFIQISTTSITSFEFPLSRFVRTCIVIFSSLTRALRIGSLHVFNGEHTSTTSTRALSSTRQCSAGSARTSKSKKEDVDHFSLNRLAMAAGKRNFSLPAGRTMPLRPANNYIVQWKITGLNILHVETEMPVPCQGFSNIGVILYL